MLHEDYDYHHNKASRPAYSQASSPSQPSPDELREEQAKRKAAEKKLRKAEKKGKKNRR